MTFYLLILRAEWTV